MKKLNTQLVSVGVALLLGFAFAPSGAVAQTITVDKLHSYVGVLGGAATFAPSATRPHAQPTDWAIDFTMTGGTVTVTNASFLNVAGTNNTMSVAFWVKKYDVNSSSAFWAQAPSSNNGQRAFQMHLPWSNNRIYFDTSGCCDAGIQRIDEDIGNYMGYTGDQTWWNDWHHFVFLKNGDVKQVWIDGVLFMDGVGTAPLPTDMYRILLGTTADGGLMHGQMDDLAIYATGLVEADIQKLFTGIAPDALGASTQLLAYWEFNPPPIGGPAGTPTGFTIQAYDSGAVVMNKDTVELTLNGASVTPTSVQKDGLVTTITYNLPNPPFPSGSTNYTTTTIKDQNNNTYTSSGSFVVSTFSLLTQSMALPPAQVDKSKKGFKIRTYQVDTTAAGNGMKVAEDILAGVYGPNVANPNDPIVGAVDAKGYYTFTGVINLDIDGPISANGQFRDPDYPAGYFPGIPGFTTVALPNERFACEFYTALEFTTAGLYTMVVNSDDCFATYTGPNPLDPFSALKLGTFDSTGGRGAADTAFQFYVQQPGLYGFRTAYQQGGGGGNIEWFMVNPNGVRVLLNDITNAISAYQWLPTITAAYVESVTPANQATAANPDVVQAVIVDGSSPIDKTTVSLKVDGVTVNATVDKVGPRTTVTYLPSPMFPGLSSHTATLSFTDTGNAVTRDWQFSVAAYTKDVVRNAFGTFIGNAKYSASAGGRTGQEGDYSLDLGTANGNCVFVPHAEFLNIGATNDTMTFSIWVKRRGVGDSSAFWAHAMNGGRGWQAHLPWSNNNLYFDTAGCCNADTRISLAMDANNHPPYTGTDWWLNWHHFVCVKNANVKEIWVDGRLFVTGDQAIPLPLDFTDLIIGAESFTANTTQGWLDDLAIYATALSPEDIAKLAGGSAPDSLAASTQLLALWNFNDAPASVQPTIGITRSGAVVSINYTGKLMSSATADGVYTEVTGATSPYTVDTTKAVQTFYRAAQ